MIIAINAMSAKTGGNLTYTKNLLQSLRVYKDYQFHIWVPTDSPFEGAENVILHFTEATNFSLFKRLYYEQFQLKREIKRIGADILFSAANFGILTRDFRQILLIRQSSGFNRFFLRTLAPDFSIWHKLNFFLRRNLSIISASYCDIVMFPSQSMCNDFLSYYPAAKSRVYINPYGTLNQKFQLNTQHDYKTIKLLYVSVYYSNKNPGIIADATKILKNNGHSVSARITMDMDTQLSRKFPRWDKDFEKINDLDVKDNIILGSVTVDETPMLFQNANIFVFPSFDESFGHPMIEAMSAGLPIIAADIPINREVCGNAAVYFSPFDAEDLSKKILMVFLNKGVREKLISVGRDRVMKFQWEDHVKRLIEIFKSLKREDGRI